MSLEDVVRLLDKILEGGARDLLTAQQLEGALDELFPEDPKIQEFVAVLASYRPGGGDLLYNEADLAKWALWARTHLSTQLSSR